MLADESEIEGVAVRAALIAFDTADHPGNGHEQPNQHSYNAENRAHDGDEGEDVGSNGHQCQWQGEVQCFFGFLSGEGAPGAEDQVDDQ